MHSEIPTLMIPSAARQILLLVTGMFFMLSSLHGYENFCEPEIQYIYVSELTDSSGNIYLMGLVLGEADMDPGEGKHILSNGLGRSFILKLDREGNFLWVKQLDADISDMVLDRDGNLVLTGSFWGDVDFDPDEGTHVLSVNGDGMFILRLDPSGSFMNVLLIENAYPDVINQDDHGKMFISGDFYGIVDFDPGADSRIFNSDEGEYFILMFQEEGQLSWVRQFDSRVVAIAPDDAGNLFFKAISSRDEIGKIDGSGNLLWQKEMPYTHESGSMSISNSGIVTIAGEFLGRIDFDPGPGTCMLESEEARNSVYVLNLDQEGNFLWAGIARGGSNPRADHDADGNLLLAGYFTDSMHIHMNDTEESMVSDEEYPCIFLLRLDQAGNLLSYRSQTLQTPGAYTGTKLMTLSADNETYIVSGILEEEDPYQCANTMAFVSRQEADGSVISELTLDLEGAGDPFEDNDSQNGAAFLEDNLLHEDLTISMGDEDWYELTSYTNTCENTNTLTISCFFNHSEGDINLELVNGEGSAVVISRSSTDNEQIIYTAGPEESCYLRVYLSSGNRCSYSLWWEDVSNLEFTDPAFLYALIEAGVDSNGDSLISSSEAELVHFLDLAGKGISDMDGIGCFPNLDSLDCSGNDLDSLDLRDCPTLKSLICDHNHLEYLDVSENTELQKLSCHNNLLTQLLISTNEQLQYLDCSQNQLAGLYLIYNRWLTYLDLSGNPMEQLNLVLNPLLGSQSHTGLFLSNMPSLKEVCVYELPYPPPGFKGTLDTTGSPGLSFTSDCRLESFVYIPDLNFRNALFEQGVDENRDGQISLDEARYITSLDVSDAGISDMTGIEAFINLDRIYCQNNELTLLDLSQNVALRYVYCDDNLMDTLDVSALTNLTRLYCRNNRLDTLDVSNNTELSTLDCSSNQLRYLDVSPNASLRTLRCENNLLNQLILPESRELNFLYCNNNKLKLLELSDTPELSQLYCSHNLITGLDLSKVTGINIVQCEFNRLDSIKIAGAASLRELSCNDNLLNSLVVSGCSSLENLNCSSNRLSKLDLGDCRKLRSLHCEENLLDSLDLSGLTGLALFHCSWNQLSSLDVSANKQLIELGSNNNLLTSLDLSSNINLEWISLENMPKLTEVCVWQLPFPPDHVDLYTSGSPDLVFKNSCGSYADPFEENDEPHEAAILTRDQFHQNLIVTGDDEDWYLLINESYTSFRQINVECIYDSTQATVVMELFNLDGMLLASSRSGAFGEVLDYISVNHPHLLLHVRIDSGYFSSYSLHWNNYVYEPHSDLSVCMNGFDCSRIRIHPESDTGTFTLDTLKLDLFSGDRRTETVEITNEGPGSYLYYSILNCISLPDSMNKAIRLNGTDAYIQIPRTHSLDAPEEMTIEAWIRNDAEKPGDYAIVSKGFGGAGYELYVAGDPGERRLGIRIAQADIQSDSILKDDCWYHVAATYTNHFVRLYINGILDRVVQIEGTALAVNQDLFIGARRSNVDSESIFPGDVDEVRIWNIVRSDDEIHAYMHRELKGQETGLIGYWPFSTGTMRAVIDEASGNHGLMMGGAERISSSNPVVGLINWQPETGFVSPDSTVIYQLEFNAAGLNEGTYITTIEFISNKPFVPDIRIPTSIHVTEAASFDIQPETLNLGEIHIYQTHTSILTATNHGTQVLVIDSTGTDLVGSRITPASATLLPGESETFKVNVFQRNFESFSGKLTFFTNDPNNHLVEVPISGEGTKAVEVAILQQIDATLPPESMYLRIMGFENNSTLHGLTLYPSLVTYHLAQGGNNLMLEADSLPRIWIRTTLPEIGILPPGGILKFDLILESYALPPGDYYADVVLEWYNPFYHKGYMPVRMHVQHEVGIKQKTVDTAPVLIYPNPTRGELYIRTTEVEAEYQVIVCSVNGRKALEQIFTGNFFRLDLSGYPKGIYVVSVRSEKSITNQKIILD